jgi:hypothetical protein
MRRETWLVILLLPAACNLGGAYDRDYVLYDPAAAREAEARRKAADDLAEAERARPPRDDVGAAIARVFVLEGVLDELDRAIGAGLDPTGGLAEKRAAVLRELEWRRAVAGDALEPARRERLAALKGFATVER